MSSETVPQGTDTQVAALQAADARTETRLTGGGPSGAAYVDVTDGQAQRRPIIPGHLRDGDGLGGVARGVRRHLHHQTIRHGHAAAYHGVRSPRYLTLTVVWAVVGLFRTAGRILAWWHCTSLYALERQAAADGLLTDHLRIHKQGRETRTARGIMVATVAFVVLVAVVAGVKILPGWAWIVAAVVLVPVLARAGRPAGKPIVHYAVLPASVQPPTQDVITRALGSLGIAGIDRWLRDGRELVFPPLSGRTGQGGGPRSICRLA